jgi:hypothetical protein|tara:strand:+ start:616 stop:768 length:153 start_codon:yes stop_codon:yes gene_type:complete
MIVECKAEMRGLDQELIMTKIEMALLKCQIEETNLEIVDVKRLNNQEKNK